MHLTKRIIRQFQGFLLLLLYVPLSCSCHTQRAINAKDVVIMCPRSPAGNQEHALGSGRRVTSVATAGSMGSEGLIFYPLPSILFFFFLENLSENCPGEVS